MRVSTTHFEQLSGTTIFWCPFPSQRQYRPISLHLKHNIFIFSFLSSNEPVARNNSTILFCRSVVPNLHLRTPWQPTSINCNLHISKIFVINIAAVFFFWLLYRAFSYEFIKYFQQMHYMRLKLHTSVHHHTRNRQYTQLRYAATHLAINAFNFIVFY